MKHKVILIILLALCALLPGYYSRCDDEECYQHYKRIIANDKGNIRTVFDGILEKYGDVEGILKDLLVKLNGTIQEAERKLDDFKNTNDDITHTNNMSNSTIQSLLNELSGINDILANISDSRSWTELITNANLTANLIVSTPATLDEVEINENEINKWKQFLSTFNETKFDKNITNIAHSVSNDLDLIEALLNEEHDIDCFNKLHEDLKKLFVKLTDLMNIDGVDEMLTNLQKRADKTREKANDIFNRTEDFLEKEKAYKIIHDLANETLNLAGEIEDLKNNIDKLFKNNEDLFDQKLKALQKSHEADLVELYKKYNIEEYKLLLDELEDINRQIEDIGGEGSIDSNELDNEITGYMNDLEYYSCILNDCRYRKPAEATGSFNCKRSGA